MMMLEYHYGFLLSEEQPYDFGVKGQGQTCKVWISSRGGGGGICPH